MITFPHNLQKRKPYSVKPEIGKHKKKRIKKLYERKIKGTYLSIQCPWHFPAYKTKKHMEDYKEYHEEMEKNLYLQNGPDNDEIIHKINEIIRYLNKNYKD